ncbi:MAG TPA: signal recognition particle-docking protein FtsY [Candidatus Spyradocola merdavium]|nr:signal recognition particle-docking protein FtsY [Candidatus Spyradocola merdavium]
MTENREKKGLFARLREGMTKTRESITHAIDQLTGVYKELDDDFYDDLEAVLIGADIGVKTTEEIIARLKDEVRRRREGNPEAVRGILKEIVADMMQAEPFRPKSPSVILVVGVNGVGKTTTIGKLACHFKDEGKSVILAAADTFRAAATEQLTIWAQRAGVPIVAHGEGADPAAVVFDAVASAKAKRADLLIVDTAGRLHNKSHLMEELKKIRRVIDRDFPQADVHVLLVLDGATGQNGVTQARVFRDAVDLSGIVLTKLDGTSKGGVVISIKEELQLPVYFVGVGEKKEDLQVFNAREYAEAIF